MTMEQNENSFPNGGKYVVFYYTISIVARTFKRPSKVFYIAPNESPITKGYPYLLISLLFGWWGIPWGPIYTIQSIYKAFVGEDVTNKVLSNLSQNDYGSTLK